MNEVTQAPSLRQPSASNAASAASSRGRVIAAMALVVVIWSANYTVAKIGLMQFRPITLASFRIVLAGLAVLPVALYAGGAARGAKLTARAEPIWAPRLDSRELRAFAFLAFFGVFLNQGLFTLGLGRTSVGHASIIGATAPIFILLAAWAQGIEGLSKRKMLGLILAFVGAAILATGRGWNLESAEAQGDLMTLVAVFSVTIATIFAKRVAGAFDAVRLSVHIVALAGLYALPVAVWQALVMTRGGEWAAVGWEGWVAVAYMGILSTALSIPLYFWVLRSMPPSKLGALSYLQPLLGTPIAALVLGEALTPALVLGGILILGGVYAIESSVA
jgi:drug/metabolite transporter (DMT)-like permease